MSLLRPLATKMLQITNIKAAHEKNIEEISWYKTTPTNRENWVKICTIFDFLKLPLPRKYPTTRSLNAKAEEYKIMIIRSVLFPNPPNIHSPISEGKSKAPKNNIANTAKRISRADGSQVKSLSFLDIRSMARNRGSAIAVPQSTMAFSTVLLFLAILYRANPSTPRCALTTLLTAKTTNMIRIWDEKVHTKSFFSSMDKVPPCLIVWFF